MLSYNGYMLRTTFYLSDDLHHRLRSISKQKKKPMSRYASELLERGLKQDEYPDLDRLYKAFEKMKGIAKEGVTDASTTIDEVLYGEEGAWRGSER